MAKNIACTLIALSMAGCAGLDVTSITANSANNAHKPSEEVDGYIVYHPMVVVEVGEKELCMSRDAKGNCVSQKNVCQMGEPTFLPDYSKPYLVTPKSGLGKAGIDVKIEDGWRLGGIKDESDNTALLGVLAAAAGYEKMGPGPMPGGDGKSCSKAGIYRLDVDAKGMKLTPLHTY